MDDTLKQDVLFLIKDYWVLGFDIRCANTDARSVDSIVWKTHESTLLTLEKLGFNTHWNYLQLLDCPASILENVLNSESIGLAITAPMETISKIENIESKIDKQLMPVSELLQRQWHFEGFDVADVNGYFSVLGMSNARQPYVPCLFSDVELAKQFIPIAEKEYPEHSPFGIFAVWTYQITNKI